MSWKQYAQTGAPTSSMRMSSGDMSAGLRTASMDAGAEAHGSKATDWASIKVLLPQFHGLQERTICAVLALAPRRVVAMQVPGDR